jgi:hypothetical protein
MESIQLELTVTFDDDQVAAYLQEHGVHVDVKFRAKRAPRANDNAPTEPRHYPTASGPFGYDGSYPDEDG